MYDLGDDPDEMRNVFNDPAYTATRQQLEGYLAQRPDDITLNRVQVGMA